MTVHDPIEELNKLIALRASGAITEAEFTELKRRLIFGRSASTAANPAPTERPAVDGYATPSQPILQAPQPVYQAVPAKHASRRWSFSTKLIVAGLALYGLNWLTSKPGAASDVDNEPSQAMYNYVNKVHHCTWCGKEYRSSGYIHVMDSCVPASGSFANIDVQCSTKCCMDSWNSGRH